MTRPHIMIMTATLQARVTWQARATDSIIFSPCWWSKADKRSITTSRMSALAGDSAYRCSEHGIMVCTSRLCGNWICWK